MWTILGSLSLIILYMELVYHTCSFGAWETNPIFLLLTILAWSCLGTVLIGALPKKIRRWGFDLLVFLAFLLVLAQRVYLYIFKQPLLWEAVFAGGQDALTNYWREALEGILSVSPSILFMLVPCIFCMNRLHRHKEVYEDYSPKKLGLLAVILIGSILGQFGTLKIAEGIDLAEYEVYEEFYDSLSVVQDMGVFPMFQRDSYQGIKTVVSEKLSGTSKRIDRSVSTSDTGLNNPVTEEMKEDTKISGEAKESEAHQIPEESVEDETCENTKEPTEQKPRKENNEIEINRQLLTELSDNKKKAWLTEYIMNEEGTNTNEYTGIFEGYNLIFLTAEGFSPYCVSKELTPTLYRMVNSGFVFDNYYVPLWQTSTSDGEYINCTGLIPDRQFSMKKSAGNNMAYALPGFFKQDSLCMAYHNNTISYYDRYLSHNNLGYFFKGCMLGGLSKDQWGDHIFEMEHPKQWPASDLEMMEATMDEYVKENRFLVYYMTVSGHLNYNFRGNAMSAKNRDAVKDLELSETGKAYIACNIELDKALEYILKRLEDEGKLENTVICLSADHFPYGMEEAEYEELAGRSLSEGMEKFRNNLILWNASMEEEPVHVSKACGSMDLLPTLLNLFGFDFDSRMYAGRDIFSNREGLVIFNDRSFVTDSCIYRKRNKQIIWLTDENGNFLVPEEEQKEYLKRMEEEVKNRYDFSAYVLQEDYYADVVQACE